MSSHLEIKNYSTFTILIVYSILSFVLTYKSDTSYTLMDESYNKGSVLSTNIKDYKTLFDKKIEYIRNNRGLFTPANESLLQQMENKINSHIDLPGAFITTLTIPGNLIGYKPITAYDDTTKMVCFQLEQGCTGWYWLYGTFPQTKDCFLFELTRVDLLPTPLRESLGYQLGDTTIYALTLGIGNGKEYYYGNVYFEGVFTIENNLNFSIVSKDNMFQFHHRLNKIEVSCKDMVLTNNKNGKNLKYTFSAQTQNNSNMYFNQENGCFPCDISNNSYQSYTNLYVNMSYSNQNETKNVTNGVGWMDHEWGSGQIPNIMNRCILTILNKGRQYNGLPPYIWLNIRLSDNVQYMIFSIFENPPKKGDTVQCSMNKYEPSIITFFDKNQKVNVKVVDTFNSQGIEYPTVYEVSIDDTIYTLDSRPYGETFFVDALNTNHWGGSCDVMVNNKQVGTGFLEAQRFDGNVKCLEGNFKLLGFDPSENFAQTYYDTRNTAELVASYAILIVLFSLLAILLWRFGRSFYEFMKTPYTELSGLERNLYMVFHFLFIALVLYFIFTIVRRFFTSSARNSKK